MQVTQEDGGRLNAFAKEPRMQVTQEDGGKLNAFAKEPRMVVMESGEDRGANRTLLVGGLVLVVALMAVAALIS